MKNYKDGLSRQDRLARISPGIPFSVIDNDGVSLLNQAMKVASFLRYYDHNGNHDGYFDELLNVKNIPQFYKETRGANSGGKTEPSLALLLIFLENLQRTTADFNKRWEEYPVWYLNNVLKVNPLAPVGNKVWVALTKKPFENVTVKKDTRFTTKNQDNRALYYKLAEDIELLDTTVQKGYILNFEKDDKRYPEAHFNFVTGVRVKELNLQSSGPAENKSFKTVGVKITSKALLLREGERNVNITFFNQGTWEDIIKNNTEDFVKLQGAEAATITQQELLASVVEKFTKDMFFLTISTTEGWTEIKGYVVTADYANNSLILNFTLPESFPPTTGCTPDKHHFYSKYPKLNVHLNFDAWLYPYSWMKSFMLYKVKIENDIRGINNLQVYNELGQVDVSKPFPPFGIANEKGSWFAVGNYEMAIKDTQSADINIQWRQLPEDEKGLQGYYGLYEKNINNTSFTLQSRFLANFNWRETPQRSAYYLFNTKGNAPGTAPAPGQPLQSHTLLPGINLKKMPPVTIEESDYKYTTKSRSGFVDFVLESPDMGFGEAEYRKLFTEQLMKNARKSQKYPDINQPMNPLVERITLNYKAEDTINLNEGTEDTDSAIDAILPIDTLGVFPESDKKAIPFAVDMEDSNILLGLKNVSPGKLLSLYFDLVPSLEEIAESNIPRIHWYIGKMRNWKAMPQGFIQKDETRRLSVDGRMQFLMPEVIDASLYDNEGLLWIRGGLKIEGTVVIPKLQGIYVNAVQLALDMDFDNVEKVLFKHITAPLEPEKNIPGVTAFQKISSFYEGREAEDGDAMLMRVSEHITHQGRAVTPRDYERITLQAFNDIAKVKCYRDHCGGQANIYVVVLPFTLTDRPLVSNYMMVKLERYLRKLSSLYVDNIRVTNPVYQEILVRAVLSFNGEYLSEARRKLIADSINNVIAPWQGKRVAGFNYSIHVERLRHAITKEFKDEISIEDFEVIRIEKQDGNYKIYEYTDSNAVITPPVANVIFVPAKEHIINISGHSADISEDFGIDEMTLENTFIIQ